MLLTLIKLGRENSNKKITRKPSKITFPSNLIDNNIIIPGNYLIESLKYKINR